MVRPTVMAKISNPALTSTRMQQTHCFRHVLHAEQITDRSKRWTPLDVHPRSTPLHVLMHL